jgi:hypothetical protein
LAIEAPKLAEALAQGRLAPAEMGSGNPEPYLACWANSDSATLFGAWGPVGKGFRRRAKTFRWVGTRFRSGRLMSEPSVVASSGDLAYTVGFERGEVTVDDRPPSLMTLHVTHLPAVRRDLAAGASPRRLPASRPAP